MNQLTVFSLYHSLTMESDQPTLPTELYYVVKDKLDEPVRYKWKVEAKWGPLFHGKTTLEFFFEIDMVFGEAFNHFEIFARMLNPVEISTLEACVMSAETVPLRISTTPSCCETPEELALNPSFFEMETASSHLCIKKDHPQYAAIDRDIRQALFNVFMNRSQ